MANSYFKFKQFTIHQHKCAMKVGTDGVLLGAWVDVNASKRILDIGTGSGLIALMIAQRNNTATIDAVEIDKQAAMQATENIQNSPWHDRIQVHECALQNYTSNKRYDLIVSNPPFFANSLKAESAARTTARHNVHLGPMELIEYTSKLLTGDGLFALIYPVDQFDEILKYTRIHALNVKRICNILPTPEKPTKRVMAEFIKSNTIPITETIIVEKYGRHNYSEEYRSLCKDFYLNM